uniref:Early lactation protein n=1 Tax=Monodelphis domestica TaxID=13616 RepID=A0A5F8G723_MONDO
RLLSGSNKIILVKCFVCKCRCLLYLLFSPLWHPSLDICQLPEDQGPCRGFLARWFFNKKNKRCEPIVFGGCGGNANIFKTKIQCMKTCSKKAPCSLPKDEGSCTSFKDRWFHNPDTQTCQLFKFRGCGGNDNNFLSESQCLSLCKS